METKTILQRLFEAQKQIGKVVKNAKNPHFKNTYADINAIVQAVEPILHENGLLLMQPIEDGMVKTKIVCPESSATIESAMPLTMSANPQAMGSQITYYRRYTLQSLLSLQVEDDDGQQAATTKPLPTIDNKRFEAMVETIQAGKYTVKQAMESFSLSFEQKVALNQLEPA
jgi:hypothetical protein